MARINTALKERSTILITGQGGFGKTQTAVEYAYRHASEYDCIWYFNAESETLLCDECREFALTIGLPEDLKNDPRRVNSYISNWFNRNKSLFIYDNAEGCPKLCEYLPQGFYSGHIIFNSRDDLKGNFGERIDATVFSHKDAMEFIRKRVNGVNDDEAKKLAYSLGSLPLALEQAVAYMNEFKHTCGEYLALLESKGLELLDKPSKYTDYDKTVTTTWNITFERLEKDAQSNSLSLAAVQLLNLCAYCAPDDIPLRMFIEGREQLPQPLCDVLYPDNILGHDDVVGKLKNCSLVSMRRDDGGIMLTIHRLIQAVVNRRLYQDTQWLSYCLDAMHSIFTYVYGDRQSMDAFGRNQPHALEIARHTESTFRDDNKRQEKVAYLYRITGFGLYHTGDFEKELMWQRKALDIRERVLGAEHPNTANTYNNIASVYRDQGNYAEALVWYRKALDIRERVLGAEHPDTAASYNNIALVYHGQGDYTKALEWSFKALSIHERVLGVEHPDTAVSYNNIALVYHDQGKYEEALVWHRKALDIRERVLGAEHPDTAASYNNIALVYHKQGEYAKALVWYRKALDIRVRVLGAEHFVTANSYNNIATVYRDQGNYAEALVWHRKALDISVRVLGAEHLDTANTYNNIATVYHDQGKYEEALALYLKSYRILLAKLGETHPKTAKIKSNMEAAYAESDFNQPFEDWLQNSLEQL